MEKRFVSLGEGAGNVGMSAAVRFGDCIAVSGQVALNESGELVGRDDFDAQIEQCFANLAAVLEQAGGTLADAVDRLIDDVELEGLFGMGEDFYLRC